MLFPVQFVWYKLWDFHHCYAEATCSFSGLPFQAFLLKITQTILFQFLGDS